MPLLKLKLILASYSISKNIYNTYFIVIALVLIATYIRIT